MTQLTTLSDPPTNTLPRAWEPALFVGAVALLIAFRLHAFALPLEVDECVYAYTGERLLAGERLYTDLWDHHPFGGYALFAGAIALFGDAPVVFRWMATGFSAASLGLIWAIARRIGGAGCAAIAGVLFALASSDPGMAGEGCNREIYINTFVLAAWLLAIRACTLPFCSRHDSANAALADSDAGWKPAPQLDCAPCLLRVLLAGVLLGIASAFKMVVAVHWVALLGYLVVYAFRAGRWRQAIVTTLVFSIGPLMLWIGTGGYFALTNRWDAFLDATLYFNLGYAGDGESLLRFWRFFDPVRQVSPFPSALPLWIAAGIGISLGAVACLKRCGQRYSAILPYLVASYVAVCLPGRFFAHYYYLVLPPLVLLAALACVDIGQRCAVAWHTSPGVRWAPAGIVGVLLLLTQWTHYLSQPPIGITGPRYHGADFWARAMGEKLATVTDPDDTVFVYGDAAGIYYYAQRRCASRHIMAVGLAEGSRDVELHRKQLLDDIAGNNPRVIMLLFAEPPFPEWTAFLHAHYSEPVGWDMHDVHPNKAVMYVLEDPTRPIKRIDWNWNIAEAVGDDSRAAIRTADR
ncbi:MAG: hypothetical protein H6817_09530 [Phycisphaerales bacterium]|nr:hypothetical protein [Phycisphaerales bacterium]